MLPFNRVYTPQELMAASRLIPADPRSCLGTDEGRTRRAGHDGRRALVMMLRRLFSRNGVRRSAPGTI